jgi:hypothetical protein
MVRTAFDRSLGRRGMLLGGVIAFTAMLGHERLARADSTPTAEVMVIHATKCDKKSIDPQIGDAAPALGYECLKLVEKKTFPLAINQPNTTKLPNGRTFQLVHSMKIGPRYRLVASISPPDGSAGFMKLAEITADVNKSFNVGGFAYKEGVLVLTVKILP